jgi:hypothetical protein
MILRMIYADVLRSVLERLHDVFERYGVWHCLIYGTLLGAVRDGDIIEWDHDLDLLIRPGDIPQIVALENELAAVELRVWHGMIPGSRLALNPRRVPWVDMGALCIMSGDWTYGDLWAPAVFSDGVLRQYDFEREVIMWPEASFAAYFIEELRPLEMHGIEYPVPAHSEELLRWQYGDDWREPYKSVRDGGAARSDRTSHGTFAEPTLRDQLEWCRRRGWDPARYAGQPAWPRPLGGAGPWEDSVRARHTSGSAWWHSLEEVANHY